MPADSSPEKENDENLIQWEFEGASGSQMFLDVTLFSAVIKACYEAINSKVKRTQIQKLLSAEGWIEHYLDKKTGRRVLSESKVIEHDHERRTSVRPDTIANRIKGGSDQASRVILDIRSDISAGDLIDGLRSGTGKNNLLKEVFLFYKNRFYILPKNLIWSKRIYQILKNEKGYT